MGDAMNFSEALKLIKMGDKVKRFSWDSNDYLAIGGCGSYAVPIVVFHEAKISNWVPLLEDFEAEDWWVLPE